MTVKLINNTCNHSTNINMQHYDLAHIKNKLGVYKLNCDKFYIGQVGHFYNATKNTSELSLKTESNYTHKNNQENLRILHSNKKRQKINTKKLKKNSLQNHHHKITKIITKFINTLNTI